MVTWAGFPGPLIGNGREKYGGYNLHNRLFPLIPIDGSKLDRSFCQRIFSENKKTVGYPIEKWTKAPLIFPLHLRPESVGIRRTEGTRFIPGTKGLGIGIKPLLSRYSRLPDWRLPLCREIHWKVSYGSGGNDSCWSTEISGKGDAVMTFILLNMASLHFWHLLTSQILFTLVSSSCFVCPQPNLIHFIFLYSF